MTKKEIEQKLNKRMEELGLEICIQRLDDILLDTIVWHIIITSDDLPKEGIWILCKVRGSDDLKLVCGFENVVFHKYDAWAIVKVPF